MNYSEALDYTHSLLKFGIKPGLERVSRLLSRLGNPQKECKFVHVAGTNGKGSTCAMISSILRESGKKTGLFISPYIVDFRERIQIDGEYISEEDFANIADKVKDVIDSGEESPTEFEFITAVAFLYFKEKNCDVVVLETGLGGRFDSTNVIDTPLCSVIASISLDHVDILGDTLEKIAEEKCGIIKENGVTVTSPLQKDEALEVIARHCAKKNNTLRLACDTPKIVSQNLSGTVFEYGGEQYKLGLLGEYQMKNVPLAIEAANVLGIDTEFIKKGLENAVNPARFEVVRENPYIIIDGAHNEDGALQLKASIDKYFNGQKVLGVCGMLADKSYERELEILKDNFSSLILMTPDNPRALPAEKLKITADKIFENTIICDDAKILCKLIEDKFPNTPTVIFGSLYLASELRKLF
ncbi:MAG: bifunctional folylpolyglutamate synthase/dihydrofolate synthase [Clostridia bacterium]|nr:bifunctional folylpolyglutamate synthase/dihydrofolate synthase [Clostridia bacterium]